MLKLTDDGAKITLQGQPPVADNGLFWFGAALLIGAVATAAAMSLFPVRLSIGALALLIVGSFVFNHKRQQKKQANAGKISGGVLWVRPYELVHDVNGRRQHITLDKGDKVTLFGSQIQIVDDQDQRKYHISGFDNDQEAQAARAILQGNALGKRHVNIKMNDSPP